MVPLTMYLAPSLLPSPLGGCSEAIGVRDRGVGMLGYQKAPAYWLIYAVHDAAILVSSRSLCKPEGRSYFSMPTAHELVT